MFRSVRVPRRVTHPEVSATHARPTPARGRFASWKVGSAVIACSAIAWLGACSGEVAAQPRATSDLERDSESFEPPSPQAWDGLVAHNQRIAGEGDWDGSLNGLRTLWYEGGAKRGEGRFVRGSKEGDWVFWYENGQKRWEGSYHADLVQGSERSWYPNGKLCFEGSSVEGQRHGQFRAWYEDGSRWWEGEYEMGKRQGEFRYWQRDGSLDEKVSGRYEAGKRVQDAAGGLALAQPR